MYVVEGMKEGEISEARDDLAADEEEEGGGVLIAGAKQEKSTLKAFSVEKLLRKGKPIRAMIKPPRLSR